MHVILTFYAFFALLGVGLAWFVFRRLRRFGRLPAGIAGLLCLTLVVLCFPLPIHGGFTTLLESMLDELGRQQRTRQREVRVERKADFLRQYEKRFGGELGFENRGEPYENWQEVVTAGGQRGWFNQDQRLIWSEAFPWRDGADFSLAKPRAFCDQLAPPGYWSLPSSAEMALFWQAGGGETTGGPAINAASFSVDFDLLQELPNLHLSHNGRSLLRCVARASDAPLRGYLDQDIPRDLWNSYQLTKTSGKLK